MKHFLIREKCSESSECPYALGTYLVEASSIKEAQEIALKNVEDYFHRENVERRFGSHRITVYQVTETMEVDLKTHVSDWIQRKDVEKQQQKDQQERAEFDRLSQKFGSNAS